MGGGGSHRSPSRQGVHVRALSPDEYAHLRGDHRPGCGDGMMASTIEGARLFVLSEALRVRGCVIRVDYPDGSYGYNRTALGVLALRVSRPEMAFQVPT